MNNNFEEAINGVNELKDMISKVKNPSMAMKYTNFLCDLELALYEDERRVRKNKLVRDMEIARDEQERFKIE